MLVGMTYDLRSEYLAKGFSEEEVAEFDSPRTVEGIEDGPKSPPGTRCDRIGSLPSLVGRLAQGDRWDLVFNIAEGLGRYSREAQVPALLEYYGVPYTFADPLTLCLTLHKGMAKRVVRDLGLATPDFAVVSEPKEAAGGALALSPVRQAGGRGHRPGHRLGLQGEWPRGTGQGLHRADRALPSAGAGGDLSAGPRVHRGHRGHRGQGPGDRGDGSNPQGGSGADPDAYTLRNKEECDDLVRYRRVKGSLAGQAGELALAAWRGLECRDAGRVDLRCDAHGQPSFLEVNPLAGLHPGALGSAHPLLPGGLPLPKAHRAHRGLGRGKGPGRVAPRLRPWQAGGC